MHTINRLNCLHTDTVVEYKCDNLTRTGETKLYGCHVYCNFHPEGLILHCSSLLFLWQTASLASQIHRLIDCCSHRVAIRPNFGRTVGFPDLYPSISDLDFFGV